MKRFWSKLKMWRFYRRHPNAEGLADDARAAFAAANQAAIDSGAPFIGSLHVLVELLRTVNLFRNSRDQLESRAVAALGAATDDEHRDIAERVIEEAIEEARRAAVREIDAQLILADLCRLDESPAARLLSGFDITLANVRASRSAT